MQGTLRFENVTKRFGDFTAVDRVTLEIEHGKAFSLLGPSGCGKTTLLRMAAGFETPDEGRVLLDVSGDEKAKLTVETLVERFHLADDKLLLA